ncbi:hypothetical protein AGDE_07992 [Angomonas deanei]|uniref:Exocyst complex component Sec3, putative n=1 Tax=Angomonas deanei TaxID=59799 RepID=A0A7G2CBC6_9TRYP|nr:hypothetical protein AGDE_07992 [Angomonas deanei]CAD2217116.1 Exocyst complex component Sec3, putative [Angomonas deanei]|eukprot:EPY34100.1 hypothetical protein AGDE_07992 [Angomonas deanei]
MERLGELKPVVESIFRQRLEEVTAGEVVTEIGAKHKGNTKPRLAVLCRPLGNSGGCSLNLLSIDGASNKVKIKQTYAVDRLTDISHDGQFDATLNFAASGLLSISFGSNIQREMFVAAVKKLQAESQRGTGYGRGGADGISSPIRGVLSETVGAAADADAADRVRKLRQDKRRVFSKQEEDHLMKSMEHNSFDDIASFQDVLLRYQKEAELSSVDSLIQSSEDWVNVKNHVQDLILEVDELEGRIERYTTNLLSKKGVIQQIEHENSTLQQQQTNLETLYVLLADLKEQLGIKPEAARLLARLRMEPENNLVNFFSEGQNAAILSTTMRQMHSVLNNKTLEKDFPIAAVSERKIFFIEQRRMIALRSQTYIFSLIETCEEAYLNDKTRFSRGNTLVWRTHTELTDKLTSIKDILKALSYIDRERFIQTQRRYRTSMQKVYALEVTKFLKCLRRQVRKVSRFKGPFLLGTSQSQKEALNIHMESAQAGQTPRMFRGTPSVSPMLTPRMFRFDDDVDSHDGQHSGTSKASGGGELTIEFPSTRDFRDVELFDNPNTLRRLDAKGAGASVATGLKSLVNANAGGYVRPELGFAIALESTMVSVLQEEKILGECFGVSETVPEDPTSDPAAGGDQAAADKTNERAELSVPDSNDLFFESLLEVFGGSKLNYQEQMERDEEERTGGAGGLPPLYPGKRDSTLSTGKVDLGDFNPNVTPETINLMQSNFLVREFTEFTRYMMDRCDRIYSLPMLCMIKGLAERTDCVTYKSSFCRYILRKSETIVNEAMMRFVAEQTDSIARCKKKYLIKPTALLHCFTKMPAFFMRMEAVHNGLSMHIVDKTVYSSVSTSLVDQSFEVLDFVTNIKTNTGEEGKLRLREQLLQKLNVALEGKDADASSVKRGFIQQYRHHAFFCAFYASLPSTATPATC